jgi:uncharacterized lipoprotein YmbA
MMGSRAILALSALVLGLVGCAERTAPSRFFVLAPVAGPVAAPAQPGAEERPPSIGVGPVRLPAYVDRPQIVTRKSSDEIDLSEFNRWAEPLADSVPRTIAENLTALLPNDRIALFPWTGARALSHQVVIDVARFDGALGGTVSLDARWRILGPDRKDVRDGRFAANEPTAGPDYAALVAAMSRSLGALSREIAAALRTR